MEKKKVLFVISSLDAGGAQRALSNIVCNFPDEWDIDILLNNSDNIVYPYKGRIASLNIKNVRKKDGIAYQFKVFIKRLHVLRKMKKQNKYKACISFLDSANIANIITGNKYGKTIVSVRINLTETMKTSINYKYIVAPFVKLLYRKADYVVGCSKDVSNDLINNFNIPFDKVTTIYNGYNIKKIQENSKIELSKEEKELFFNSKVIVTSGRLEIQKGQWHLIKAFQEVISEIPSAKLLILGDGNLEQNLKLLVKKLNLGKNVFFLGFQTNPYNLIRNSDIFVLPSLYEGFPNALAEALICGKVCVATDFRSGAREILSPDLFDSNLILNHVFYGKYGIIIPCMNNEFDKDDYKREKNLAKIIVEVLTDKQIGMDYALKIQDYINTLSIEKSVKSWINLIK